MTASIHKLIIFDCDGVLVDSEMAAALYTVNFLATHGVSMSWEEIEKQFRGQTIDSIEAHVLETTGIKMSYEQWVTSEKDQRKVFLGALKPLLIHTLTILQQKNMPRCVASNSHKNDLHDKLVCTDQKRFFENSELFSAQDVARGKPAPDLFLYAAKQMGHTPQECLVIEDSETGIRAAQAANMTVIGFLGASSSKEPGYHERIAAYNIPVAQDEEELLRMLIS